MPEKKVITERPTERDANAAFAEALSRWNLDNSVLQRIEVLNALEAWMGLPYMLLDMTLPKDLIKQHLNALVETGLIVEADSGFGGYGSYTLTEKGDGVLNEMKKLLLYVDKMNKKQTDELPKKGNEELATTQRKEEVFARIKVTTVKPHPTGDKGASLEIPISKALREMTGINRDTPVSLWVDSEGRIVIEKAPHEETIEQESRREITKSRRK